MVDFVEQATLRVRDQSSAQLNKINKAVTHLLKQASKLNNMKIGFDTSKATRDVAKLTQTMKAVPKTINTKVNVKVNGVAAANKQIANLGKTHVAGVRIRLTNLQQIRQQLQNNLQLNVRGPRGNNQNQVAGRGFAASFLNALRPENAGASIARGFLSAVGGNLQSIVARTAGVAGQAPLNKEDAVQKLRTAGLDESTITFMQQEASRLSGIYKGTTETSILEAGREAAGRIGDPTSAAGQKQLAVVMDRLARNTQILSSVTGKGIVNGGDQARLIEGAISQVGATNDPVLAERISTAIVRGVVASGGDLSAVDAKRILQQVDTARGGMSDATLTQLLLVRDEGGMRSSGAFRQFFQDTTRGSLNDEDFANQVKQGIRTPEGKSLIADDLQNDFLATIENVIIPKLKKLGIDVNDKTSVGNALDTQLGFTSQAGIGFATDAIINLEQAKNEYQRARQANLRVPLDSPTVRQRGEAVNAQFQNLADNALGGVLPVVSAGLATVANSLAAFNKGEAGITDFAALGAGAVSAGIGASIMSVANADPTTRPLALAGLSLNTSAAALSGAAAALTGAAGVQAGAGALGSLAGNVGRAGGLLGLLKSGLVAAGLIGGTAAVSEIVQVPLDKAANALSPGSVDQAKVNEAEIARRGWDEIKSFVAAATGVLTRSTPSAEQASSIISTTKDDSGFIKVGPVNAAAASPDFAALLNSMNETPTELTTAFDTGNAGLSQASSELAAVSQQFGPLVAAALLATGGPLGAQIGAAISAAISAASVNVNATVSGVEPSLDTGSQLPKN